MVDVNCNIRSIALPFAPSFHMFNDGRFNSDNPKFGNSVIGSHGSELFQRRDNISDDSICTTKNNYRNQNQ